MEYIVPILILTISGCTSEPLQDALKRRSDAYGAYARDFADEYEPVAYAMPLHAPVPVIHVLSRAPHPHRTRDLNAAGDTRYEQYASPPYASPSYASRTYSNHKYARPEETAPIVLYARQNKNGGYTYRRRPTPPKRHQDPVILRIHRYRVVRDD